MHACMCAVRVWRSHVHACVRVCKGVTCVHACVCGGVTCMHTCACVKESHAWRACVCACECVCVEESRACMRAGACVEESRVCVCMCVCVCVEESRACMFMCGGAACMAALRTEAACWLRLIEQGPCYCWLRLIV